MAYLIFRIERARLKSRIKTGVMTKAIMINPSDNTATLFGEALAGDIVRIVGQSGNVMEEIKASEHIPVGHKIAVREMAEGERVIKYGQPIGAEVSSSWTALPAPSASWWDRRPPERRSLPIPPAAAFTPHSATSPGGE